MLYSEDGIFLFGGGGGVISYEPVGCEGAHRTLHGSRVV